MSYSTFLSLSWSVSRGRDTYGYNIARLDDRNTGERFRCMGGGYDMVGTVFGDWLEKTFQSELTELVRANEQKLVDAGYQVKGYRKLGSSFYGLTVKPSGSVFTGRRLRFFFHASDCRSNRAGSHPQRQQARPDCWLLRFV